MIEVYQPGAGNHALRRDVPIPLLEDLEDREFVVIRRGQAHVPALSGNRDPAIRRACRHQARDAQAGPRTDQPDGGVPRSRS